MDLANVAARCRQGRLFHHVLAASGPPRTPPATRKGSDELQCLPRLLPSGLRGGRAASARFAGLTGACIALLAACGGPHAEKPAEPAPEASNQTVISQPETPKIHCAAPGSSDFAAACTIDRTATPTGVILTLRHPDGAFHRLQITRDGRGVIAADGAEPAKVTPLGPDRIEVELGGSRYRLPATVRQ